MIPGCLVGNREGDGLQREIDLESDGNVLHPVCSGAFTGTYNRQHSLNYILSLKWRLNCHIIFYWFQVSNI